MVKNILEHIKSKMQHISNTSIFFCASFDISETFNIFISYHKHRDWHKYLLLWFLSFFLIKWFGKCLFCCDWGWSNTFYIVHRDHSSSNIIPMFIHLSVCQSVIKTPQHLKINHLTLPQPPPLFTPSNKPSHNITHKIHLSNF